MSSARYVRPKEPQRERTNGRTCSRMFQEESIRCWGWWTVGFIVGEWGRGGEGETDGKEGGREGVREGLDI